MTQDSIPDPLQIWRESVNLLEKTVNSLADRNKDSQEFAQVLNQFSKLSANTKHIYDEAIALSLKQLNLPSRTEFAVLAAAVQRIEDKLDQLLPPPSNVPRPPRTRRPAQPARGG